MARNTLIRATLAAVLSAAIIAVPGALSAQPPCLNGPGCVFVVDARLTPETQRIVVTPGVQSVLKLDLSAGASGIEQAGVHLVVGAPDDWQVAYDPQQVELSNGSSVSLVVTLVITPPAGAAGTALITIQPMVWYALRDSAGLSAGPQWIDNPKAVTVEAQVSTLQITPAALTRTALRGQPVTFAHTVRSLVAASQQVSFSVIGGGWPADVSPASATLAPNAAISVTLTVTPPASASGQRVFTLLAHNPNSGDVASAVDTLRVPLLFLPLARTGVVYPPSGADGSEPDDTCAQAKWASVGVTVAHTFRALHNGLDTDYLYYTIPTEGRDPSAYYTYTVSIARLPGNTRATPYIQMEWPCGTRVGSGGNYGLWFWGTPGTTVWLRITNTQQLTGTLTGYGVCLYEGSGPNGCTGVISSIGPIFSETGLSALPQTPPAAAAPGVEAVPPWREDDE